MANKFFTLEYMEKYTRKEVSRKRYQTIGSRIHELKRTLKRGKIGKETLDKVDIKIIFNTLDRLITERKVWTMIK